MYKNSFIIAAYANLPLAEELQKRLTSEGLPCKIGNINIHTEELDDSNKEIKNYDSFIIVWSLACARDIVCISRITKVIAFNKKALLLLTDDASYPPYLSETKTIKTEEENFYIKVTNELGLNLSEEKKHSKEHYDECYKNYKSELENDCGYLKILGSGNKVAINQIYLPLYVKGALSNEPIAATNLLEINATRIVVLGNPGTGKTTLLKYLSSKSFDKGTNYFPFFIKISEFMKTQTELYDYIKSILRQKIQKQCTELLIKNDEFCTTSRTLILLDGLDEISTIDKQEFNRRLILFIENFHFCKIIITSRYNEYNRNDFNDYSEFQIEQLREIDIEKYIWKICEESKRSQILSLIKSDSRLLELSKTPFLLAMICTLPNSIGKKANQRAILFQQCTQYLLRHVDWEINRPIVNEEKAKILETALQKIAVNFFKLDRTESFDEQELLFIIGRINGNTSGITPTEIIKLICDNSGLLQKANSFYHFIHRSIWEYFVAKGMLEENFEQLFERASISAWEEPIRLYIGLLPDRKLAEALRGIWKQNRGLALRCMTEIENFPEQVLRELFEQIDKDERISVIRKLKEDIKMIASPIDSRRVLIDTLSTLLRIEKDCEVIYFAIELLREFSSKNNICFECESLISRTLDLKNSEFRRNKLLADEKYKFEFICIPEGKFVMGRNDLLSTPEEKPEHVVFLSSFCIGVFQVTNNVFYEGSEFPYTIDKRESRSNKDSQPAISITWYEAYIFALWLGCDLPTEAEWEYACRVGGKDDEILYNKSKIGEYAWYQENSNLQTQQVGLKKPNSFGLYDMIGNVREWCKDWFSPNYYLICYEQGEIINPRGPESGTTKSMRGGCFDWGNFANLLPTYRNYNQPSDSKFMNGFRIVLRDKTVTKTSKI